MRPKKVVLVVHQNEQELSVLSFMLGTNGFRILSASDPHEAMVLFMKNPIDLVIADAMIPKLDGISFAENLKHHNSFVPVLLIGATAGVSAYADASLQKKALPAELLERTKVMVARKRGPRKGSRRGLPSPLAPTAVGVFG